MPAVEGWAVVVYQGGGRGDFRVGGVVAGGGVPHDGDDLAG